VAFARWGAGLSLVSSSSMKLPQTGAGGGASPPGGEGGDGALPLSGGGGGMSGGGVGSPTGAAVQPKEKRSKAATKMAANVVCSIQAP